VTTQQFDRRIDGVLTLIRSTAESIGRTADWLRQYPRDEQPQRTLMEHLLRLARLQERVRELETLRDHLDPDQEDR
jgi:hypothetical protein